MPNYFSPFLAVILTLFFISLLRPISIKLGLVDHPGGRKAHKGRIPLIGGVAMFCAFSFSLLTLPISLEPFRGLIAASLLIIITGVLDDFHELSAKQKFLAQFIAVLLIALWGHSYLYTLGKIDFLFTINLGVFAIPFTVFAIVGVINALNMVDGHDGLAGGLALIQFILLYYLAWSNHNHTDATVLLLFIGITSGFLWYNFPLKKNKRKKIFMGDAGSMFLGLALGWFCIRLSQGRHAACHPITMLWIMSIPLFDSISAIVRRVRKGLSPFFPDRAHFHHIFHHAGFSPIQTVAIIYSLAIIIGLIGILGDKLGFSQGILFLGFLLLFAFYLYCVNHAWKVMKVIKRK